ncbi:MAG: beta-propeller fold lactonase family protein [Candidatus Sulfotelmatobacter sp.]
MKRLCFVLPVMLLFTIMLFASFSFAQSHFVYTDDNVNVGNDQSSVNTVSAFSVAANGSLSLIAGSPFTTGGSGGGNNIDPEEIAIATLPGTSYLYAANDGSGTIAAFRINAVTGYLMRVNGSPFMADGAPGGDYSLAVSPNGKFLFATEENVTVIHVYSINPTTGALTEISSSPFQTGVSNQGLNVTANGKFLIVGEGAATAVAVYSIGSNGTLTPVSGSPFAASAAPLNIQSNCAGNLAFVADTTPLIDVYSIGSNGALTPVPGEPFSNGTQDTNGGLALSPNNDFLFVSDTFTNDLSSLAVASDGTLSQGSGSPFSTSNWTGGMAVTKSGKFLYTSLFTVAEVDARAIDEKGKLAPVPGTPFSTGQSQTGVPTVITFPPPACPAE